MQVEVPRSKWEKSSAVEDNPMRDYVRGRGGGIVSIL